MSYKPVVGMLVKRILGHSKLKKGGIYTISGVEDAYGHNYIGLEGVYHNSIVFFSDRFIPVSLTKAPTIPETVVYRGKFL